MTSQYRISPLVHYATLSRRASKLNVQDSFAENLIQHLINKRSPTKKSPTKAAKFFPMFSPNHSLPSDCFYHDSLYHHHKTYLPNHLSGNLIRTTQRLSALQNHADYANPTPGRSRRHRRHPTAAAP